MLRKNLYSQKFKPKPIKPSYVLTDATRTATIKIIKKYAYEIYDGADNYLGNSLGGATEDFLENYRINVLPEVTMGGERTRVDTEWFLSSEGLSSKTQFLDFIQIFIDYTKHKQQYTNEINTLFELDNFGYRIMNEEITKIGSQETFEITKKAFGSIKKIKLGNARIELQGALRDYYSENKPIAIKKALDSIDTVLKFIIINDDNIVDKDISNGKGQTKNLIVRVVSAGYFLCPGMVSLQIGIEHILAPLRNKIPGAGHSMGLKKTEVDDETVELAIGLAASYANFLIKRFLKNKK